MFIKKAREFTGLCVFDKWKGYINIYKQKTPLLGGGTM